VSLYFIVALRNLLQARRRTVLLGSALALVTLLLVLLLSLVQGLTNTIITVATAMSSGHVNVAGFYKTSSDDVLPLLTKTSEIRKIVEENTPDIDYIVDRNRGFAKFVSESSHCYSAVFGVDIDEEKRWDDNLELAEEREYKEGGSNQVKGDPTLLNQPNSLLLFANQAKRLEVVVGDKVTVMAQTTAGVANTLDATVVAVIKDIGIFSRFFMFMPKQDIHTMYNTKESTSGAIQIYLKDIDRSAEVMEHLRSVLDKKGYRLMDHDPIPFFAKFSSVMAEDWDGQKLDLTIWSDEVSFLNMIITTIRTISLTLVGILMVLIAIGIMNTMWIAVRERTTEIGTIRAIGASKMVVLRMFLMETALLGLFSTTLGAVLGGLLAYGIDAAAIEIPDSALSVVLMTNRLHLSVSIYQLLASILILSSICALAALWPSLRASRLQPITAIHHVV